MRRVGPWWSRAVGRSRREDRVDAGLAVAVALVVTAETLTGNYDRGPVWVVLVTGLLLTLPLAVRRRWPLGVYAAVLVLLLVQEMLIGRIDGVAAFFALLIGAYTVAAHNRLPVAVVALLAFVPVFVVANVHEGRPALEDLDFLVALVGGFWVAGRVVASRQRLVDQMAAQAVERERRREAEARAVAAEERASIARDVHDVIAHSVSLMVVQAEAGEAVLPDAGRAGESLRAIQAAGRATLRELRQLLGTLDGEPTSGGTQEGVTYLPSPSLRDAGGLVGQLRSAGLDVTLCQEGSTATLPSGVDLAAYRVLQEALTNALRHAGRSRVEAAVCVGPQEVLVSVTNDVSRGLPASGVPDGSRRGLAGMRERVAMYGGEVSSGPVPDGFRVLARIPLGAVVRAP